MTTLKEEILLLLEEGLMTFLNPYHFHIGQENPYHHPRSLYTAISRLEKKGMVRKFKKGKKLHLKLTAQGRNYLAKHRQAAKKSTSPWDHQWRLVIFDIPEDKADLRKYLTQYLYILGFRKVQRSVWLSPHDYKKKILRYLRKLKISDYVFHLNVNGFAKLSDKDISASFWELESLNNKYLLFHRQWSKNRQELEVQLRSNNLSASQKDIAARRYVGNLIWEYQSIKAIDPHLPAEILPEDWAGLLAKDFVKESKNILIKYCRSIDIDE